MVCVTDPKVTVSMSRLQSGRYNIRWNLARFLTCGTQVLHVAIFELFFMVVFNLLTTSFRCTKLLPNAVAQWNYISK